MATTCVNVHMRAAPTLLFLIGGAASAQAAADVPAALAVSAPPALSEYRDAHRPIELRLSRPLHTSDGMLVILAGSVDVTALVSRTETLLTIVPGVFALPAGESQITVMTHAFGHWTTVATFPIRVLSAAGFVRSSIAPTININSTGQVADGQTAGSPVSPTRPAQDVTLTTALRSNHERPGLVMESQSNLLGASREALALRFNQRGTEAPLFDLSDYRLSFRRPHLQLDVGNIQLGANRQLLMGFASRGVSISAGPSWAVLTIGSVAGAPIVGWDNPLGLAGRDHRVSVASLGLELIKRRPGAALARFTLLDGVRRPVAGFAQGLVADAERSRGGGFEFLTSSANQRLRGAIGYTRSAFENPATDSQLVGGLPVVRVVRDQRAARYIEASAQAMQNKRLFGQATANVTVGWRHERIDPLYRSIGVNMQADRNEHAFDLNGTIGPVALQGAITRARDNLANLSSLLSSRTQGVTANFSVPVAALFRAQKRSSWFPQATVGWLSAHQFAVSVSALSEFRPEDIANQKTVSASLGTSWQFTRWQFATRTNRTVQDNRQTGREEADFSGLVQTATMARSFGQRLDGQLEVNVERQHNDELAQTNTVRRVGVTTTWRVARQTTATTNVTAAVTRTPPNTTNVTNLELRSELAQAIHLFGRDANARTGQLFLRFARTSVTMAPFGAQSDVPILGLTTQVQWTLNTGLSARLW